MPEAAGRHAVIGVSALLFAASAGATVAISVSMSGMAGMPMPGGWTLAAGWLPMCGQTWAGAAVSFAGMWTVMMVAMMLPSLAPLLLRHRRAWGVRSEVWRGRSILWNAAGYFCVWIALGWGVFALGSLLAQAALQMPSLARAAPVVQGMVVLLAGAFQFTHRKAHHLAYCRSTAQEDLASRASAATPWRSGVRLGLHCIRACAGLTAILLVIGVMDWRAMAAVTAAITAERIAPAGERMARAVGVLAVAAGVDLVGRAVGFA